MRFHTPSLVCSALVLLLASVVAAQSAPPLDGTWEGTIVEKPTSGSRGVRQPTQSPVAVGISTASDGRRVGKWLIAKRIADIGEVAIDGDAVRIVVPKSGGVWEGKLSSDGLTLAGEWRQSGRTTPLVLRRTGNPDEPVTFGSSSPGTVTSR